MVQITEEHRQEAWIAIKHEHAEYLKNRRRRIWTYIGGCALFGLLFGLVFGEILRTFDAPQDVSHRELGRRVGQMTAYIMIGASILGFILLPLLKFLMLRSVFRRTVQTVSASVFIFLLILGIVIYFVNSESGIATPEILLVALCLLMNGVILICALSARLEGTAGISDGRIEERAVIIAQSEISDTDNEITQQ